MKIEKDSEGWNVLDNGGNVMARCPVQADAKRVFRGLEVLDEADAATKNPKYDGDNCDSLVEILKAIQTGKRSFVEVTIEELDACEAFGRDMQPLGFYDNGDEEEGE